MLSALMKMLTFRLHHHYKAVAAQFRIRNLFVIYGGFTILSLLLSAATSAITEVGLRRHDFGTTSNQELILTTVWSLVYGVLTVLIGALVLCIYAYLSKFIIEKLFNGTITFKRSLFVWLLSPLPTYAVSLVVMLVGLLAAFAALLSPAAYLVFAGVLLLITCITLPLFIAYSIYSSTVSFQNEANISAGEALAAVLLTYLVIIIAVVVIVFACILIGGVSAASLVALTSAGSGL